MRKKYLCHLLPLIIVASLQSGLAKSVCEHDPNYDMMSAPSFVEITEGKQRIILHSTGDVTLNNERLLLSAEEKKHIKALTTYIQNQLTLRESEATILMDSLHAQFIDAVNTHLDGNRQLTTMLDNVHQDATRTLGKAIRKDNQFIFFSAKDFHKIIDRASSDFKLEMAKIFSKSILTFNLGRNYKDIKYLGEQEWKKRKPEAKAFHQQLCEDLTFITEQKGVLLDDKTGR